MDTGSLLAATKAVEHATAKSNPFRMDDKKRLPRFAPVGRSISLAPASKEETLFPDAPGGGTAAAPESTDSEPTASTETAKQESSLRKVLFGPSVRAEKAAAEFGGMQQAELKLDQVRVVRNDLNESDFELVAQEAPTALNSAAKEKPKKFGGVVWNWLSARLFSLGRRWQ